MKKSIDSWQKLERAVLEIGMLPYFINKIPGFSVEENVPDNLLWDINEGPWEWKGQVIRNMRVAYGKIFAGRAGYISAELLPDFMNVRRSLSKLEAGSEEERIYRILVENDSLLSKELKTLAGYTQPRRQRVANPFDRMAEPVLAKSDNRTDSRFESIMTKLQVNGYVVIADFEYLYDRKGDRYGWGVARYTTPEALYEATPAKRTPDESFEILRSRLLRHLPGCEPRIITKFLLK